MFPKDCILNIFELNKHNIVQMPAYYVNINIFFLIQKHSY